MLKSKSLRSIVSSSPSAPIRYWSCQSQKSCLQIFNLPIILVIFKLWYARSLLMLHIKTWKKKPWKILPTNFFLNYFLDRDTGIWISKIICCNILSLGKFKRCNSSAHIPPNTLKLILMGKFVLLPVKSLLHF